IALSLSPVLADSIRMSLQLIVRASRIVSLPLNFWLSITLPRLIPWLIQIALAAKPITGKRWVQWRLRYHTGEGLNLYTSLALQRHLILTRGLSLDIYCYPLTTVSGGRGCYRRVGRQGSPLPFPSVRLHGADETLLRRTRAG